jgi:hypothetical protein
VKIAGHDAELLSAQVRQMLDRPASRTPLARLLEQFASLINWQTADVIPDRELRMRGLHDRIAARGYPLPIVTEALRRLVETEEWVPPIARVLANCEAVLKEVKKRLHMLEAPIRHREEAVAGMLAQADREISKEGDEAAEYREWCVQRRRAQIEALRKGISGLEDLLPRLEAQLRDMYGDIPFVASFLAWQRSQIVADSDEIARLEGEISEIEKPY